MQDRHGLSMPILHVFLSEGAGIASTPLTQSPTQEKQQLPQHLYSQAASQQSRPPIKDPTTSVRDIWGKCHELSTRQSCETSSDDS